MLIFLLVLAGLSVAAVVATVVHVLRDGYGHIRPRQRSPHSDTAPDGARVL